MSIGNRIKSMRIFRGMTQKELGIKVGFSPRTADVRIGQYETSMRHPRLGYLRKLAKALKVSIYALTVPDVNSEDEMMHLFFELEDLYGLRIAEKDGDICLVFDPDSPHYQSIILNLYVWKAEYSKVQEHDDEETKKKYDSWRYEYPDSIDYLLGDEHKDLDELLIQQVNTILSEEEDYISNENNE